MRDVECKSSCNLIWVTHIHRINPLNLPNKKTQRNKENIKIGKIREMHVILRVYVLMDRHTQCEDERNAFPAWTVFRVQREEATIMKSRGTHEMKRPDSIIRRKMMTTMANPSDTGKKCV